MAKIDSKEDLPEWFDLENYQDCKNFNAYEWLRCLSIRSELMSILLTGERHGFSVKEFFNGTCSPQMLVWLAPLDWSAVRGSRWCAHEESPPPDIPVRDLTFSDLALTRQDEFEAKFAGQDDNKAELWTAFRSLDYIDVLGKLDGIPVSQLDDRQAMIIVDMDATDAVIVTAFSRELYQKGGMYFTDAREQAELEHLMLEPEDQGDKLVPWQAPEQGPVTIQSL